MTTYPGSIEIDAIKFANLKYLTTTIEDTITPSKFNSVTGKPLTNMTMSNNQNINNFFLNVSKSLIERLDVNNNFIYVYPSVLDSNIGRDLVIGGETAIDAIFIFEGASMKNMFGYYMYYVDNSGNKHLLSDDVDNQGYHYSPTVIYPYIYSESDMSNTLQVGESRRLIGNLPNGNFSNVCVGFFLVQHGWFGHIMNASIADTNVLYTSVDLNKKSISNPPNTMIKDKIYSVFAKAVTEDDSELLFVSFEDGVGSVTCDFDYNDCIIGLVASHVENIDNYNDFCKVFTPTSDSANTKNNLIFYDNDGEFVSFPISKYNINTNHTHKFERHYIFSNLIERDLYYNYCVGLNKNYTYTVDKETDIPNSKYTIVTTHLFRKNDLEHNRKNNGNKHKNNDSEDSEDKYSTINNNSSLSSDRYELYLYQTKYDSYSKLLNYKKMLFNAKNNSNYVEKYKLTDLTTNIVLINTTNSIDLPEKTICTPFRILGTGIMDCINGKASLSSTTKAIYNIYKSMSGSTGLIINLKMDNHPTSYMLNKKYFSRYICFYVNMTEHVVIDLGSLNMYQETTVPILGTQLILNNLPILANIKISEIIYPGSETIKELVSIFKANMNAMYRKVTINDSMDFYCISFINNKPSPTMVYADTSNFVTWTDRNIVNSGTYFYKQKTFIQTKFVSS
jgi:hypothetical protein